LSKSTKIRASWPQTGHWEGEFLAWVAILAPLFSPS
jgi:hypothetical protein